VCRGCQGVLRVGWGVFCARNSSSWAEKWTSVSPCSQAFAKLEAEDGVSVSEMWASFKMKQRVVFATGPVLWAGVVTAVRGMAAAMVETGEAATVAKARRVIGDRLFGEKRYPEVRPTLDPNP